MIGKTLGHYQITQKLGQGGMGIVYKARDTHLDRFVAIKVLPAEKVADPDRKRRFVQEAKAASALNHPNIVHVYDIDQSDGTDYIAMEYVDGKTLEQRIGRHGLGLNDALKYAVQIADALAKAHSAGIVHRDLKPTNIMVNEDGVVKVLDFGLAKLTEQIKGDETASTATLDGEGRPVTEEGVIVGTVAYMSPEQAEGKKVDARSDIFSFGSVLYEMVTGRRAFQGETKLATLSAVLDKEPVPVSAIVPKTPPELEKLIARCLRKDPERRIQHMDDVKLALEELKEESDSGKLRAPASEPTAQAESKAPVQIRRSPRVWAWPLAAVAGLMAAVFGYLLTRPPLPPKVLGSVQITSDGRGKLPSGIPIPSEIVTDGSRLYFAESKVSAECGIAQVSATGGETDFVSSPYSDIQVADFCPKRPELLVLRCFQGMDVETALWMLPVPAGPARRLGDVLAHDAGWSPDGQQVVYAKGPELHVTDGSGTSSLLLTRVPGRPYWPRWSPDGRVVRFTIKEPNTNSTSLWEISADGSRLHPLYSGWNNPSTECCGNWTPDGRYFIFQSTRNGRTDIWATREKRSVFELAHPLPVQLTAGPLSFSAPVPSKDGRRLFVSGEQRRGELVRFDPGSRQFVPYLSGISAEEVDSSKDGQWVTYVSYPEGALWRSKADGSERLQLTFSPMRVFSPRWCPDARQIAFSAVTLDKPQAIYLVSAEGGVLQRLTEGGGQVSWSPDGRSVLFESDFGIQLLDLNTRRVSKLLANEGLWSPQMSPDGNYFSAEKGYPEPVKLLLYTFRTKESVELANVRNLVDHRWAHDGKYVYFEAFMESGPAIFRVGVGNRKIERVASVEGIRRVWTGSTCWFGLAPDDSPILLRDIGTQEIYALDWEAP